tara:strand:- start:104 stop:304 length:201 start_codon:yes stop_codon:yes gene_type:complete
MVMKVVIYSALIIAGLHHLFHLFVQPSLNASGAFSNLPFFFAGSTSVVTVWVFILVLAYGYIKEKY